LAIFLIAPRQMLVWYDLRLCGSEIKSIKKPPKAMNAVFFDGEGVIRAHGIFIRYTRFRGVKPKGRERFSKVR